MKLMAAGLLLAGMLAAACGGGDDDGGTSDGGGDTNVVIAAADAGRVAHEGLPAVADLPGNDWLVVAEDDFGSSDGSFLEFIEGNPDCATLENLATLESVFGGEDNDEPPVGQAQIEFENQDPDSLIPTSIEVEIEIDESAAGSRAAFTIVKDLFESDDTSNCIISVLNSQFAETGPAGLTIEVRKGSGSESSPQGGAHMAFEIDMSIAGIELEMAMQMYFWPYGNATVQVLFLGTNETLSGNLVGGVLKAVDDNLKAAASK